MKVAVASDHAGFPSKEGIIAVVRAMGHEPIDLGTCSTDPVDYPDTARDIANALHSGRAERAVLSAAAALGHASR